MGVLCVVPQAEEIKGMSQSPRRNHKMLVLIENKIRIRNNDCLILLLPGLNFL